MISFFSFSVSLYSRPSYMVFSRRSSNLTLFIISWTSVPSTVYLHNFGSAGDTAGGRPQRAETPCCRPCAILYAAAARAVPPPRAQPLACEPGMARRAQGTPARSVSRCKAPQWSGGSRAHRERPRQSAQCRYRAGPATEGGGGACVRSLRITQRCTMSQRKGHRWAATLPYGQNQRRLTFSTLAMICFSSSG